ncbi:MAG: response regulator transcription factor [Lachnospiraceae bacterium]
MKNILIVEDDRKINQLIATSLSTIGYNCFQTYYGLEAIHVLAGADINLVLLDVQLPDSDGFSLIKSMNNVPVIFITAKDEIKDRVKGLDLGAEDYIVKPFSIDELAARVKVALRRYTPLTSVTLNNLVISLKERTVERDSEIIALTPQEFNLLQTFIENKNIALSREQLLESCWGYDYEGDIRTVDVHVQRLRKKLMLENELKTVYKIGYRLEVNR